MHKRAARGAKKVDVAVKLTRMLPQVRHLSLPLPHSLRNSLQGVHKRAACGAKKVDVPCSKACKDAARQDLQAARNKEFISACGTAIVLPTQEACYVCVGA